MEELTIEQLQARLAAAESAKAEAEVAKAEAEAKASFANAEKDAAKAYAEKLSDENKKLSAVVSAADEEKAKTAPVEFEYGDDTYQFTCPTFTWEDGSVVNVRAMANSQDEKDQVAFAKMCKKLVEIESGIIRRKED